MTCHHGFPSPDTQAWFSDFIGECVDDPDDLAGYLNAKGRPQRGRCDATKPGPTTEAYPADLTSR